VQDQFDNLTVLPHLDWLYELRGSELFLLQCKSLGTSEELKGLLSYDTDVLQKAVLENDVSTMSSNQNLFVNLKAINLPRVMIPVPPPLPGQIPPPPPRPQVPIPQGPIPLVPRVEASQEDLPLNIDTIVILLIKAAQIEWTKFFRLIDRCEISFPQLERTFSILKSKQVGREVESLYKTGHGNSRKVVQADENWIRARHDLITSYRLLDGHRRRIAGLLNILAIFQQHFANSLEKEDELYHSLRETHEMLSKAWATQKLSHVRQYSDPVRKIFAKFSKLHLLYLDELCKSEDLIKWYLNNASTEEFSQLLSITKSNTDDAIVLRAIASLQSSRDRLSNILYPSQQFASLSAFLKEFASIQIDDKDIVIQLSTANEKFDFLMKIFAEKTRSPGMQACYDLKDIMDDGTYVWSSTDTISASGLSLVYTKISKSSQSLDDLIDLRNRLMLTKIPDELDIPNVPALIQKFIDQLKILFDISRSLTAMQNAGHFAYIRKEETFPSSTPMSVLLEKAHVFKNQLEEWGSMMQEMRKNYYFLNFFSVTQLVQLLEYLDEGVQAIPAIHSILRIISTRLPMNKIVIANWKPSAANGPRERLEALGQFLGSIFNDLPPLSRATKNIVTGGSAYLFDEGSQGLYVITTPPDKVIDLTFTLYVQQGRVPEPDEVLFL